MYSNEKRLKRQYKYSLAANLHKVIILWVSVLWKISEVLILSEYMNQNKYIFKDLHALCFQQVIVNDASHY